MKRAYSSSEAYIDEGFELSPHFFEGPVMAGVLKYISTTSCSDGSWEGSRDVSRDGSTLSRRSNASMPSPFSAFNPVAPVIPVEAFNVTTSGYRTIIRRSTRRTRRPNGTRSLDLARRKRGGHGGVRRVSSGSAGGVRRIRGGHVGCVRRIRNGHSEAVRRVRSKCVGGVPRVSIRMTGDVGLAGHGGRCETLRRGGSGVNQKLVIYQQRFQVHDGVDTTETGHISSDVRRIGLRVVGSSASHCVAPWSIGSLRGAVLAHGEVCAVCIGVSTVRIGSGEVHGLSYWDRILDNYHQFHFSLNERRWSGFRASEGRWVSYKIGINILSEVKSRSSSFKIL
ncbi:hypothetical protein GGS26DRAFT_539300 [Hypomontagnella submonticulosa]|nr:hypothetical protein GGS26DRAFT_539300 [Hypomontagnella submonticulosa]